MSSYHLTGEKYDLQYQGYKEDLNFYLKEAKKAKNVLEIGCGTGRILLPALKAGVKIEGLDGSRSMLKTLNDKAAAMNLKPKTYYANMIDFNLNKKYDLIIIPFRTFLHLLTQADQKKALRNFHKHLSKNGKLILNFFHPDCRRIALKHGRKEFLTYVKNPVSKNRIRISALNYYFPNEQLLKSLYIFEELDKHNLTLRSRKRGIKLRYIFRYEFEHLLALTGFKVLKLLGNFNGEEFGPKSRELIWIAQKIDK